MSEVQFTVRIGDDGDVLFASDDYAEAERFAEAESDQNWARHAYLRSFGHNIAEFRSGEIVAFLENGTDRWVHR